MADSTINVAQSFTSAKPGCKFNEDSYGYALNASGSHLAWVIDGMTGYSSKMEEQLVGRKITDAAWFAHTLNKELKTEIFHGGFQPRNENVIFRHAIEKIRHKFNQSSGFDPDRVERYRLPSAAGILMAVNGQNLAFTHLGDCSGIVINGDRILVTESSYAEEVRRREEKIKSGNRTELDRKNERSRLNIEGGYWAYSVHPEAADHMVRQEIQLTHEPATVLLMSDGLERAMKFFALTPTELVSAVKKEGLHEIAGRIRATERAMSPEALKAEGYSKRHDDITAMLLEIEPPDGTPRVAPGEAMELSY